MPRFFYFLAFFLTLSCARAPRQALWQCVEMDQDSSLTVNDSIARYAYNYYSRHGSARHRMMATYYLGQAEYDAGLSIPATLHFKQAYDLAVKLEDPSYMGFACQRLSWLYTQNYDISLSTHYAQQAISLLERCGDTLSANLSRIDLADRYMAQEKFNLAESIVDSLLISESIQCHLEYYTLFVKANLRFFQNDYDTAEQYYNRLSNLSSLTPILYGRLALIAEHQGRHNKADSLINLASEQMTVSSDSANVFFNKEQISFLRGNYKDAYENQRQTTVIQDRCVNDALSRSVTHSMQAYYEQEYQAEKTKRRDQVIIYLLSLLVLLTITIVIVIALRRRKEQIIAQMAQMETLTRELQQMRKGEIGAQAVISTLVQDKIKTMSQLANAYLSWSDEAVNLREAQQGKTFKEDIISDFRKELRRMRDDEHFIPTIERALNHSYSGIITRIRQDCRGISNGSIRVNDKDFQLLVLFFAGFSNSSVAFILDMTDDAVRTRKKNLRKVLLSLENGHGKEYLDMLNEAQHKSATKE